MRVAVSSIVIAISILCCSSVLAATNLDAETQNQLVQLEQKYFGHSFDSDSDEHRTERLEKLVYGDALTGEPAQRIKHIASSVSDDSNSSKLSPDAANNAASQTSASEQTTSDSQYETKQTELTEQDSTKDQASSSDSYPRITALENAILGKSFAGQQLPARLTRMETKAFGKSSTSSDLGQRTDNLEQYVEQVLHKKSLETAMSEANSSPNSDTTEISQSTPSTQTDYPRIDALEKAILGQTFPGQSLADRLSRMESKAFGNPSNSTDLSQRTDTLETYAEKKLHMKPPEQNNANQTASTNTQHGSGFSNQLLSMLGNSLLGMAGLGGLGMPGMGPGFTPGFSGVHLHSNQAANQQQQPSQPVQTQIENPLVFKDTPPPPAARLIVKVGWCEQQVFGETFPKKHLAERLQLLNEELRFEPGKSSEQLMDDIALMIKAVQAQKQSEKSIGSISKPVVH